MHKNTSQDLPHAVNRFSALWQVFVSWPPDSLFWTACTSLNTQHICFFELLLPHALVSEEGCLVRYATVLHLLQKCILTKAPALADVTLTKSWHSSSMNIRNVWISFGAIHLWRPQKNHVFGPLSPLSTWAGPPFPLVDVHTWSTGNTHCSLEMASTMTCQT